MDQNNENNNNDNQGQNLVDRINTTRNRIQRLRRLKNAAQGLRTGAQAAEGASAAAGMIGGGAAEGAAGAGAAAAAEGAAAAATEATAVAAGGTIEFWGPLVAIIAGVLLLIFLFIVIFTLLISPPANAGELDCTTIGGTCMADATTCTSPNVPDTTGATCSDAATPLCCVPQKNCGEIGGTCSTDATCASVPAAPQPDTTGAICGLTASGATQTCCVPKIDCDNDPTTTLKQEWNVVVTGTTQKDNLTTVCNIYKYASKASTFKTLLTNGGVLTLVMLPCSSDCISSTTINQIKLNGFFTLGLSYNSQRYLLLHESGHVIRDRNQRLGQQFATALSGLVSSDGTACYNGRYMKSYSLSPSCNSGYSITPESESFAEGTSSNAVYKTMALYHGRCSKTITNYSVSCGATFAWIRDHVYGGFAF